MRKIHWLFCQSFEDKAVRAHQKVCNRPLPGAYLGRGRGKLTSQSDRHVIVCHDSSTGIDGKQLVQRCKLIQWLLELQSLQHRGLNEVKQVQLWQKIFRAPGFSPDFPTWLLKNDVADEAPFTTPSQLWIDKVCSVLSYEKQLWRQAHQRVKRENLSRCMQHDWSKGGRLHAGAIKPTPLGTLDSLVKEKPRTFKLLRCKKGGPLQLQMLDEEPYASWCSICFYLSRPGHPIQGFQGQGLLCRTGCLCNSLDRWSQTCPGNLDNRYHLHCWEGSEFLEAVFAN